MADFSTSDLMVIDHHLPPSNQDDNPRDSKRQKTGDDNATEQIFKCKACDNKTFTTKRALLRHLRENKQHIDSSSAINRPFLCKLCDQWFVRAFDRQRHVKRMHSNATPERHSGSGSSQLVDDQRASDVQVHMARIDGTDCTANLISAPGPQQGYLQALPVSQLATSDFVNSGNDKTTWSRSKTWRWSSSRRKAKSIICSLCQAPFQDDDRKGMSKHLNEHMEGFRHGYECYICQMSFVSRSDLRAHELSAKAGYCGFAFQHREHCTGHHAPDNASAAKSGDRFDFCCRVLHWSQRQLQTYQTSIAALSQIPLKGISSSIYSMPCSSTASRPIRSRACRTVDIALSDTFDKLSLVGGGTKKQILRPAAGFEDSIEEHRDLNPLRPSPQDSLCVSIRTGNITAVRDMLKMGCDVNARGSLGYPPLFYALIRHETDMTSLLLQSGADVNIANWKGRSALESAIWNQANASMISMIIQAGANVNATGPTGLPMLHAALSSSERYETLRELIRSGADVNALDRQGRSALHVAAEDGKRITAIEELIQAGADVTAVNQNCASVLHVVVSNPQIAHLTPIVINAGANVNATDISGRSVLHAAVASLLDTNTVSLLIQAGANVNAVDSSGRSVLHKAVAHIGNLGNVQVLLRAGSDVGLVDNQGSSVLTTAVIESGDWSIVKALIQAGADVSHTGLNGDSVLHSAIRRTSDYRCGIMVHMAQLLVDAGADVNARDVAGQSAVSWVENYVRDGLQYDDELLALRSSILEKRANVDDTVQEHDKDAVA